MRCRARTSLGYRQDRKRADSIRRLSCRPSGRRDLLYRSARSAYSPGARRAPPLLPQASGRSGIGLGRMPYRPHHRQSRVPSTGCFSGFRTFRNRLGKLRAAGASSATVTRDLADMIAKGALARVGERRHARYHVGIPLRPVAPVVIDRRGEIIEGV